MSQPAAERGADQSVTDARSDEQVRHERAMGAVSDVLFNIEGALAHAKKAKVTVDKDGTDVNASLALGEAVRDLGRIRKRLMQDTYFAVDTRLI